MKLYRSFVNRSLCTIFRKAVKCDFRSASDCGKISVTRKKITRDSVQILEAKPAVSVLKNLNWENYHLFGGVIKNRKSQWKKSELGDKVNCFKVPLIQYDPNLSVYEEEGSSKTSDFSLSSFDSLCKIDNTNKSAISDEYPKSSYSESILNNILEFPLLNDDTVKGIRSKASMLQQHLQKISSTVPSVTAILDRTMPPESVAALERWKMQMIKKMGKENFEIYQKEMLLSGSTFHNTVNDFLHGIPKNELIVHESNIGHWKSIQSVLPDIHNVKLLEEHVTHPFLKYRGVVDCIALYRGHLVVVEWKTSKNPKPTLRSTYDNPLQLVAYVGALNFDPRFQYMVDKGLIVIVYEGGDPAHSHFLPKEALNEYWKQWLQRLKKYWETVE